jgi:ADP-ribosylglycohydrolase
MTGGFLIGLILVSMLCLFAVGGLIVNFVSWRALRKAKEGAQVPSGFPFLPGIAGSLAVFFALPALARHGIDVPWPWLWILLPFFLDMYGPGGFAMALLGFARKAPLRESDAPPEADTEIERRLEERRAAAVGCLLGTAVGDALGLPCEGLSRRRQARWYPTLERYRLVFGKGMCSDDTDHACMLAQALAVSGGDARRFVSSLAWRLRFWLLGLPAGVGFATLRSIVKLWLFVPPSFSGVRSAGNGPAMRSALLGACFPDDDAALVMHSAAAANLTHRDPRAELGALAVALAARASVRQESPETYLEHLRRFAATFGEAGTELVRLAGRALESSRHREPSTAFADSIGCTQGVSGYMYHGVPVVLHAWFSHPRDLAAAVTAVIRCGGDTDTTAAIAGAIVGAGVGKGGIPAPWLADLWDWPRGVRWIEAVAERAANATLSGVREQAVYISPARLLARNAVFLLVVLAHGFRRLAPPY